MAKDADENELIKTLIWSKAEYSFAQFITEYPLPQIVRVVDGYYGTNEDSCLGAGQVLVVHDVHSTPNVIGNDCYGKSLAIPLDCTTKALVCPLKSKLVTACMVEDLKSVYPKIKYVRVESTEGDGSSDDDHSVRVDDLLEITKINKKTKLVHFQVIDTDRQVSLGFSYPALFTLLLDSRKYSLAEIKQIHGFPARVRFLTEGGGDVRWKSSVRRRSPNSVSKLGEVVLQKEKTETTVIATTIGGQLVEKLCIGFPKDLPVNFVIAEGFLQGGGNYEEVVRTLHSNIKVTNLTDFDQIDVYEHLNAVRKYAFANTNHFTAGSDRQSLQYKKPQLPKLSTKSTKVLPMVAPKPPPPPPHDIASDLRSTSLSEDSSGYTYIEFSAEKQPTRPSSHDKNGQKGPRNSENSPLTKYEKPLVPLSREPMLSVNFGDNTRHLLHNQAENSYKRISRIPADLSELTVSDVGQVLKCLNMENYVQTFKKEMIDGPMLKDLDLETLESLNVTLFHGKKLIKFINGWRPRE